MEAIKERVSSYWTKRSADFAKLREKELESELAGLWLSEIEAQLPKETGLRILDVGTGSGFFAVLLAEKGHRVTGIDLTPAMIDEAGKLAEENQTEVEFRVMDAENLEFADGEFDAVVSRNLTWTLPHPDQAYREWLRVLKPGGVLLNFDADYGMERFAKEDSLPENHAHRQMSCSQLEECDAIKDALDISRKRRPGWDAEALRNLGCRQVEADTGVSERVYRKESPFYNPTPLFRIRAVKQEPKAEKKTCKQ